MTMQPNENEVDPNLTHKLKHCLTLEQTKTLRTSGLDSLSPEEMRKLLERVLGNYEEVLTELIEVMPWMYEACDQTVECVFCNQAHWHQLEELNQNWHSDGCPGFALSVLCGNCEDVRVYGPHEDGVCSTYGFGYGNREPKTLTPAQVFSAKILGKAQDACSNLQYYDKNSKRFAESENPEVRTAWHEACRRLSLALFDLSTRTPIPNTNK